MSVGAHFQGFISVYDDGSFTGPWNALLHWPKVGQAKWELVKQVMAMSTLPKSSREIAILVTGAHFKAEYQVYAHVAIAKRETELSDEVISSIISGQRPNELSREQTLTYDVAAALLRGGPLPELTFKLAKEAFGADGIAELIFLVGQYSYVATILNGFNVGIPAPDRN